MEIKSLVDPEGGLINRRIFADREIYELERERLFARCWLYLGHESEVANPGDFVTAYMGEEPIILWRDLHGRLGAFLNLCRIAATECAVRTGATPRCSHARIMAGLIAARGSSRSCRWPKRFAISTATNGD
ncbi:MAG TPA: Rieske 2Fe-2S domain-containing protein [Candidatus Udaeobacter sp.]|nr:Rieske 2Fe-2S domain-containing protein [Candidatus Udaeobacter sp.]